MNIFIITYVLFVFNFLILVHNQNEELMNSLHRQDFNESLLISWYSGDPNFRVFEFLYNNFFFF